MCQRTQYTDASGMEEHYFTENTFANSVYNHTIKSPESIGLEKTCRTQVAHRIIH